MPKATKVTTKKSPPKTKAIKKEPKSKPVLPTKGKRATGKDVSGKQFLDLGLLLDCTGSMASWIARAKETLKEIVDNVKASCANQLIVRVCFVGYRDHCDGKQRLTVKGFTEDLDDLKKFISGVNATGGGDWPEDITGGLRTCLDQEWSVASKKQVFHIFDAPCHGNKYHSGHGDSYPKGCPKGLVLEDLMKEFADRNISFTAIKLQKDTEKMINIMSKSHGFMEVTDLANAEKTKSAAEVTKMFVESASYILRATVGGAKGKSKAAKRDKAKDAKPLWDLKQLETGQVFSCISYLRVDNIDSDKITVQNQLGGAWFISKDLLVRDCWSADHYKQEVKVTMTDLVSVLEAANDTIVKVVFNKKIDAKQVEEKIQGLSMA